MTSLLRTIIYIPLYNILIFFVWLSPSHSLAFAIICLTILIRLALLPSSLKAARAQIKLQMLQPEINKLRKEITNQQEQSKAIMDLYKREGASPFGSCLPLLIQLPVIFILYRVFININKNGLNLDNLYSFTPHIQSINFNFLGLDLAKPELWIIPILAGATQFVLSKMMLPPTPASNKTGDKAATPDAMQMANKQMVYFFPIMTLFIARSLPAALGLYWIVTTIFGIAQQYYVNKSIKKDPTVIAEVKEEEKELLKEIEEHKEENTTNKPSYLTKVMNKRLDKQEKKAGVEVTIRQKRK